MKFNEKTMTANMQYAEGGAVLYSEQDLTDAQQTQARKNIGAADCETVEKLDGAFFVQYSPNLMNPDTLTNGAMNDTGNVWDSSDAGYESYQYTDFIPVNVGDVIVFQAVSKGYTNADIKSIRYITAFDRGKNVLTEKGSRESVKSYTVPDGVAYLRLSLATYYNMADPYVKQETLMVHKGNSVLPYEPYWERRVLTPDANNDVHIKKVVEGVAVMHTEQNLTEKQKAQARQNIGAAGVEESGGGTPEGAVLFTKQSLTAQQRAQARENIGVSDVADGGAVIYNPQELTAAQRLQARQNIGAASVEDIHTSGMRAQIRQISFLDDNGSPVVFQDVYFPALDQYFTPQGQYRFYVYGLEDHASTSTKQRVWQSKDGGETWSLFCSLPMNAAENVWYTDFAVDHNSNHIYLLKTTDGSAMNNNVVCTYYKASDGNWYARPAVVELGPKRWLSNNSFEIYTDPKLGRVAIFGEYGTTTDGTTYSLWRTINYGTSWTKVKEITGDDNRSGTMVRGDIRHWHTVKVDPYTPKEPQNCKHLWAATGDTDPQCQIYRSTDGGDNWELMFAGSQCERTCSFVFEPDCIYYGMDAKHGSDPNFTRIVKIDRASLETDRENCREYVASVNCCRSIYGLTRTFYPDGMLVYTQHEPNAVFTSDSYVLEFYDYATKKLYPVAVFDISDINKETQYIGFYAGAKYQSLISGVIFAKLTNSMQQEKYGFTEVSKHIKINLTM